MSDKEAKRSSKTILEAPDHPQRSRWHWNRLVLWSIVAGLVGFSVYVAAIAILWSNHVSELRDIEAGLEAQRLEAVNDLAVNGVAIDQVKSRLEYSHSEFLNSVNLSVRAEEYVLYFSYIGVAMGYCIDASQDVASIVRAKWGYNPYPIHAYDDAVRELCMEIRGYLTEAVKEFEVSFPPQEHIVEPS